MRPRRPIPIFRQLRNMLELAAHLDRAQAAGRHWCLSQRGGAPDAAEAARAYASQYEISPRKRAGPGMRDTLAEAFLLGSTATMTLALAPGRRPAAEA